MLERSGTYTYNRSQKSLDDRLMDGSIRGRREAVSAEASRPKLLQQEKIIYGAISKKDAATRAMLHGAIEQSILFSGMTDEQRNLIVDVMVSVRTSRNDVVIRQGEDLSGGGSDNFYVVGEGQFDIYRDKRIAASDDTMAAFGLSDAPAASLSEMAAYDDGNVQLVQQRFLGDSFGEIALMYNCPRQATVMCVSDTATLWMLVADKYLGMGQGLAISLILPRCPSRRGGDSISSSHPAVSSLPARSTKAL